MESTVYTPDPTRYEACMPYRRCGKSGVLLPALSLGFWQNFGANDDFGNSRRTVHTAFDRGITHFDLANNYGPPYGSAEETFGRILRQSFGPYRDELFISTKAGHDMWPGPYGEWGSRKHLLNSLEQSLRRMRLEYVDLFYSHRFDPRTPLEETLQTLVDVVRQGKALYVGISKYPEAETRFACHYLRERDVPCLAYQGRYNLLSREPEQEGVLSAMRGTGTGFVAFSPLAQGLLTDKYLHGIPETSRMARNGSLKREQLTESLLRKLATLNDLARRRGQSLAEMAIAWLLREDTVTSVLVGARSPEQLETNLKALANTSFSPEELLLIEQVLR